MFVRLPQHFLSARLPIDHLNDLAFATATQILLVPPMDNKVDAKKFVVDLHQTENENTCTFLA